MTVFQQRLKQMRELKGWSQEELAKRLGVSRSKIGNYEQGTREPGFEDLEAIADIFNCTIAFLIEKDRLGPEDLYDVREVAYLNNEESILLDKYRKLNFVGKKELDRYSDYIMTRPEYRTESESSVSSDAI